MVAPYYRAKIKVKIRINKLGIPTQVCHLICPYTVALDLPTWLNPNLTCNYCLYLNSSLRN